MALRAAPTGCSVAPRRGELGGNRTHDPRIKSALLYRLSYELISISFQSITMGRAGDCRRAARRWHSGRLQGMLGNWRSLGESNG